jgi:hypothetical protein
VGRDPDMLKKYQVAWSNSTSRSIP